MYQPLNSFLKLHKETLHFIFLLGFFDSGGLEILTKTFVKILSIQMSENVISELKMHQIYDADAT
jgi:hypothetical protein